MIAPSSALGDPADLAVDQRSGRIRPAPRGCPGRAAMLGGPVTSSNNLHRPSLNWALGGRHWVFASKCRVRRRPDPAPARSGYSTSPVAGPPWVTNGAWTSQSPELPDTTICTATAVVGPPGTADPAHRWKPWRLPRPGREELRVGQAGCGLGSSSPILAGPAQWPQARRVVLPDAWPGLLSGEQRAPNGTDTAAATREKQA